jgi:hypothetical protein
MKVTVSEDNHLHTRRLENLKFYFDVLFVIKFLQRKAIKTKMILRDEAC